MRKHRQELCIYQAVFDKAPFYVWKDHELLAQKMVAYSKTKNVVDV
jgi:hypothetical protein